MAKGKCNSDNGDSRSIRSQVRDLWIKNPYITSKPACLKLGLVYKTHGRYVNNLLSTIRCHHKFGLPLKAHGMPHRRVFVWEGVERGENLTRESVTGNTLVERGESLTRQTLVDAGWVESSNRNGMWVFRDDRGTVHWYKGGLVRLYLRGAVQLARAKELFCRAFSWFNSEELHKYLDVPLREELRHWVFKVGSIMPRFDIRQFERSHGIRIFTDGSHPTALEVEETQPFWIDSLEQVTEKLALEIEEHLKLIYTWQREAEMRQVAQVSEKSDFGGFDPRPIYLGGAKWWDPVSKERFIRVGNFGIHPGDRDGSNS